MNKQRVKTKTDKLVKLCMTGLLGIAMLGTSVGGLKANALFGSEDGKYYSDYTSLAEAQKAAAKLGEDLGEEGSVLLKNKDNALPLNGNEWISVLGVSSDSVEGGNTTVADSLKDAGFRVNGELVSYYSKVGTSYGKENVDDITGTARSSMSIYNDVAVVIFSRTGGESNDCATVTNEAEDNKYGSEDMGWKHNALYSKTEGDDIVEYKHYLQLTDSEEELLEFAKEKCKKVVVVINSSNVMELGNMENDDEIDGIIWVGRPGADGLRALGKILNGTVNPSGKTVDIYPADLTADPTWFGYGDGKQFTGTGEYPETFFRKATETDAEGNVTKSEKYNRDNPNMQASIPGVSTGYSVVEYSEDIYMGYRYYETAHVEAQAGNYAGFEYDKQVVYPFGYGLSYTEFKWTNKTPAENVANWSAKKTITLQVEVENTGAVAGKDVVQVYAHAPYTKGKVAKSEVVLVGFAKTSLLQPGQKETVSISVNVQDIASFDGYDANGNGKTTYELDKGTGYELRFQTDSHNVKATQALADLAADVILDEDDYSGSKVEALFSGQDAYNTLGWDPATSKTLVEEGKMTLLSRDNFKGTFPEPMTEADLVRSDAWFVYHESFDQYNAEGNSYVQVTYKKTDDGQDVYGDEGGNEYIIITENGTKKVKDINTNAVYAHASLRPSGDAAVKDGKNVTITRVITKKVFATPILQENEALEGEARNSNPEWTKYPEQFKTGGEYASWTQATSHAADNSDVKIKIQSMTGIDMYSDRVLTEDDTKVAEFVGKTCKEAWDIFMNQLTWDELVKMSSNAGWGTPALESVNKDKTSDNDSPNNLSSTYNWGDECHIASTWNVELAEKEGVIMGNLAMQKGTTWYGPAMNTHRSPFGGRCNEYYSQDGYQGGTIGAAVIRGAQSKGVICYVKHCALNDQEIYRMNLMTIVSEQAARELYLKQFQLAVQEGGVSGLMTTYGSVGEISGATNYNFMTKLLREEWGFKGYAVTDAWMPCKDYWPLDMLVRAGTDAPLENAGARSAKNESYLLSGKWDAEKNTVLINKMVLNEDGILEETKATESYTQWYFVRTCAQRILYTQSNMNVVKNGYDLSALKGGALAAGTQGVAYNANVSVDLKGCDNLIYSIEGDLPAGLSFSADGKISGTPIASGNYSFTVSIVADNWIKKTANYTMTVASAFTIDADLTKLKVGTEVDAYIESDVIKAADYSSIAYSVEGKLPAGVTMVGDHFEGTPKEAGTFEVTINITTKKTVTSQGMSGPTTSTQTNVFTHVVTLVVAPDENAAGNIEFRVTEGTLQYSVDGTTWSNVATSTGNTPGANGDKGDKGEKGDKGDKGDAGVGIVDIAKTKTEGLVDTYTVTLSDNTTRTFTVTNGKDGAVGALDSKLSISETTGNWVIDDVDTGVKAQGPEGPEGPKGADGLKGADGQNGKDGVDGKDGSGCGSVIGASSALAAFAVVLGGVAIARIARKRRDADEQ